MRLPEGKRAWLLFDVDGVLNTYLGPQPGTVPLDAQGYRLNLHTWVGPAARVLEARGFALGWATTWERDVDTYGIAEAVGLPLGLPVVELGYGYRSKAPAIVEFAEGQPFVWFDDDPAFDDHLLVRDAGGFLVVVDPRFGLDFHHLATAQELLKDWGVTA